MMCKVVACRNRTYDVGLACDHNNLQYPVTNYSEKYHFGAAFTNFDDKCHFPEANMSSYGLSNSQIFKDMTVYDMRVQLIKALHV
jgi:hypothetical protein